MGRSFHIHSCLNNLIIFFFAFKAWSDNSFIISFGQLIRTPVLKHESQQTNTKNVKFQIYFIEIFLMMIYEKGSHKLSF